MHKRVSNISWKIYGKTRQSKLQIFCALFCLSSFLPIHLRPFEEKMILDFSMCFCSLTLPSLQIGQVDLCFGLGFLLLLLGVFVVIFLLRVFLFVCFVGLWVF